MTTKKTAHSWSDAKRDLDAMPDDVKDIFGHAIDMAQAGGKHPDAKVLTGFGSAGVLEVVEDDRGSTYRAVALPPGIRSCSSGARILHVARFIPADAEPVRNSSQYRALQPRTWRSP